MHVSPLVAAVIALMVASPALSQNIPAKLPSSASPPPELQELQRAEEGAPAAPAPTREALVAQIRELPGGAQRLEQARGRSAAAPGHRKLASSAAPPPEVEELQKAHEQAQRAGPPARAALREELLQHLRELPGGAERMEEARRRGAPVPAPARAAPQRPRPQGMMSGVLSRLFARLNPFDVRSAYAQSSTFSASVTPTAPYSSTLWMTFKSYVGASGGGRMLFGVETTAQLSQYPYMSGGVSVPEDGWYIVSVSGYNFSSSATLHHRSSQSGYQPVMNWNYSGKSGLTTYPALLELSAGWHYFILKATAGTVRVDRLQVYSL